ncbi:RNA-binding motif protein 25 isoform X2 [Silene latifolia]|uniref:RNA-binding motif protein 25 isoform X2 n=1 Tax=Silene latifolia TaxID=37657 RepID=UPI003D77F752
MCDSLSISFLVGSLSWLQQIIRPTEFFGALVWRGAVRYPFPPIARPAFLPRPGPGGVPGLVSPFPRPPLIIRPPAIIRPIIPIIIPVEKPQTTVYVGKIAPSVENDFIRSLLELCGPIKSWKRAQDPSDGTPKKFGFCEFESAEGVLRALRLLSKRSVDGEELVLNVNQATRDYLERYVTKKKEELKKQNEIAAEEAKKEGESASEVQKDEGEDKKESEKPAEEEPTKEAEETENKEKDMATLGLVTDEDRNTDQEASEKLTNMIEERIKNKPLPPPPPRVPEATGNSNMEVPSKSGDKDSDIDTVKNDVKNEDETTSEAKSARAGTVSPDRRRNENRGRDRERDRDRRDKERELDRLERERERDRQRRERDREIEVQKAERFYKERVKEWETREKDREYKRKYEREKEKERERERRRLIEDQEDESDDDSRKRRRKSEIEEKRRRRRREKEEDLADKLKEEEEIAEAKKRAEEEQAEQQMEEEKRALEPPSVPVANGDEATPMLVEAVPDETKDDMEEDQPQLVDPAIASNAGDVVLENGTTEEPMTTSDSAVDMKGGSNAPTKKLGFGIVQSGKRTTVPSVFHEEEDEDAQKDKKMRPLVPIDYSTEADTQAANTNDEGQAPASESGKRANPKETKSDVEKERSRRSHDRSGHRERDRDRDRDRDADDAPRAPRILDAKQLIDMIPKTKDDLFSYDINWTVYDENRLHERMRPWISKKITEFLGEEETTLVEFIVDKLREHVKAEKMLDLLQQILDEEAEMFVLKMWRMLIFEVKRVETGLVARPGA